MNRLLIFIFIFSIGNVAFAQQYYNKDHLEYDEYGLKQVNCMRCNDAVKKRDIREHILPSGKTIGVYTIKVLGNFVAVPFTLDDGSYCNILLCKRCVRKYADTPEEREGMTRQLRNSYVLEARGMKRSKEEVDYIRDKVKKIGVNKKHKFAVVPSGKEIPK